MHTILFHQVSWEKGIFIYDASECAPGAITSFVTIDVFRPELTPIWLIRKQRRENKSIYDFGSNLLSLKALFHQKLVKPHLGIGIEYPNEQCDPTTLKNFNTPYFFDSCLFDISLWMSLHSSKSAINFTFTLRIFHSCSGALIRFCSKYTNHIYIFPIFLNKKTAQITPTSFSRFLARTVKLPYFQMIKLLYFTTHFYSIVF